MFLPSHGTNAYSAYALLPIYIQLWRTADTTKSLKALEKGSGFKATAKGDIVVGLDHELLRFHNRNAVCMREE